MPASPPLRRAIGALLAAACLAISGTQPARSQAPAYVLTDLYKNLAVAINDAGQVAVKVWFRWDPDVANGTTGGLHQLSLPAAYTWDGPLGIRAINASGQIAGAEYAVANQLPRAQNTAIVWSAAGTAQALSPQGAEAVDLNDAGDVVGLTYGYTQKKTSYPPTATLWTLVNGRYTATNLPNLPGFPNNPGAYSINNSRQVAGSAASAFAGQAWIWLPAPAYGLPAGTSSLGAVPGHAGNSAQSINDLGQVAGLTTPPVGAAHAMLWLPASAYGLPAGMNDLGGLYDSITVRQISNTGGIVGASRLGSANRACLWQNGIWQDLNTMVALPPGWVLEQAWGINSNGQIVGQAKVDGTTLRSFLLTPQ